MKKNTSKKQLREFGLIFGFGIPILFSLFFPKLIIYQFYLLIFLITIPLLIFSIFFPNLLFLPYKVWIKIGYILGWFNSKIILSLIFIFLVIPISLIMKTVGYDPLKIKKNNKKSYREVVKNRKIDLKRIF